MSDHEIFTRCSKFDVNTVEEASFVLWNVWKSVYPRYSTLEACVTALKENSNLHEVLKGAHSNKKYDSVRAWSHLASVPPLVEAQDATLLSQVNQVLSEIRPAMARLVSGHLELPTWIPKSEYDVDIETRMHMKNLRIPYLNGKPNVLLHDLGNFQNDSTLADRLAHIFMPNHHTFLVNTSGSGKTRLLLEGLCHNWGFYFTSMVDPSLLGSTDVQNSIRQYVPNSPGFKTTLPAVGSLQYESALSKNRENASRVFSQLFLARLLVFDQFVEMMNGPGNCNGDVKMTAHKKRWLLLQLQPHLVHSKIWDIFDDVTRRLSRVSDNYINATTHTLLARVRQLCIDKTSPPGESRQNPIFCVLDEAQYAATQHASAFRSDSGNSNRPILREIVRAWEGQTSGQGVFMVVAGTGISKDVVDQAMASAIMKESKYRWCSDTGAFDDPHVQRQYLEKYLPQTILSSPSGQRLLERVWYWLHGRYRFTAGYVAELLDHHFEQPHSLLNKYIEYFTDFTPTDAHDHVRAENATRISISSRYRLDFHKLHKNPDMLTTIHQLTTHYLMRSVFHRSLGQDEKTYVEYGFARFVDADTHTVAVDEPLVLLAATHWINKNYRTSYKFFADNIHEHNKVSNGFENYLAFCLNLAFSKLQRLDEVFTFCGTPPQWARQGAELVSLQRTAEGIDISPVRHSTVSGPSLTLGVNAKSTKETMAWLQHANPTPICFPHDSMGPDLLFALRLADGSLIWVAVQAKKSSGKNGMLSRHFLRQAIRSVTPSKFFIDKDGNPFLPSTDPNLVDGILSSLDDLPHRRTDVGQYGLLRVIASFPAQPGLKRCIEEDPDPDHPIACVNMTFMKGLTEGMSPVGFLKGFEKPVTTMQTLAKRTRKNSGMRSAPRKRLKI